MRTFYGASGGVFSHPSGSTVQHQVQPRLKEARAGQTRSKQSTFQHLSRPCLNRGSARRLLRLPDGQDQNDGARTSTQRDRLSWRISAACWPRNPETLVTCTVVVDDDLVVETGPHAVQNEMFETGHFMDGELTQLVAEDMGTI